MIHKVVSTVSFLIWLCYYYYLVKREIIHKNQDLNLKKNIFHLIRLDSLFYLVAFYIYKGFNNNSVTIYLYFIFAFSSLVFILYDLENYNQIKINIKKEKIYYLFSFILIFIPIIYYIKTNNIANTEFITLIINFLLPVGINIIKVLDKR